ncbi:MAG: 30S ribosomal protein S4 [Alphaproteobacteria bacterium]|nr:30S ribosomal protein S4 [Alphaproteobacteria bacterium]MBL0718048.1 30S ribosomal protein S4 [Alphaproteobacteria bacterium]
MTNKRQRPKFKTVRRYGAGRLWGSSKETGLRKYQPGQHGPTIRVKLTTFGTQLKAKQMLKAYYGNVSEKQLSTYFRKATTKKGDTREHLIHFLESRLDAVVFRAKLASTVFASRQFINHGHIFVNGKKVNIPSYQVKVDDIISVNPKAKDLAIVKTAMENPDREECDYVVLNQEKQEALFSRLPHFDEVPFGAKMELSLVVEYYSKS